MELYIRNLNGATFPVETLREALTILVGKEGYRLSIGDGSGAEIVIRTYGGFIQDEHFPEQLECENGNVVVRGL